MDILCHSSYGVSANVTIIIMFCALNIICQTETLNVLLLKLRFFPTLLLMVWLLVYIYLHVYIYNRCIVPHCPWVYFLCEKDDHDMMMIQQGVNSLLNCKNLICVNLICIVYICWNMVIMNLILLSDAMTRSLNTCFYSQNNILVKCAYYKSVCETSLYGTKYMNHFYLLTNTYLFNIYTEIVICTKYILIKHGRYFVCHIWEDHIFTCYQGCLLFFKTGYTLTLCVQFLNALNLPNVYRNTFVSFYYFMNLNAFIKSWFENFFLAMYLITSSVLFEKITVLFTNMIITCIAWSPELMVVLMGLVLKGKLCTFFFDNYCLLLKPKRWVRFNIVVILYYNCTRYMIICTFNQHMKFNMFVVLLYLCIQYMYIHNTYENTQMNMTDIECSYLIMLIVKRYMNSNIVIALLSLMKFKCTFSEYINDITLCIFYGFTLYLPCVLTDIQNSFLPAHKDSWAWSFMKILSDLLGKNRVSDILCYNKHCGDPCVIFELCFICSIFAGMLVYCNQNLIILDTFIYALCSLTMQIMYTYDYATARYLLNVAEITQICFLYYNFSYICYSLANIEND